MADSDAQVLFSSQEVANPNTLGLSQVLMGDSDAQVYFSSSDVGVPNTLEADHILPHGVLGLPTSKLGI